MSGALDKFSRLAALKPARVIPSKPAALRAPEEADVIANLLGAGVAKNHFGEHLAIRNWFSTPEFSDPSPIAFELLSRTRGRSLPIRTRSESLSIRARAALEDSQKWLFLDTETTGLAGGTGTYAFLIGLAWWDAGGLQVEQFFMRDFAEEHSLLYELSDRLAARPVLITFNGKSFDWPLLESRFTMTRSIPAPKLAAHLDLLHPARALWKLRLGSVRLTELESHVLDSNHLGYRRDDDISSAMIPQYYFDYLRGGSAAPLAGVVRHNQMDLRALAALYCRMNELLADETGHSNQIESLDLFGLSRFLRRRGDADRAQSACAQALAIGLPAEIRPKARRELAFMAKRRGEHARAAELWNEIVADPHDGIHACEQLAIYFEHHAKDMSRATEFARLALAKLQRNRATSRDPYAASQLARLEQKLMHRLARLEHRMKISGDSAKPLPLSCSQAETDMERLDRLR